MDVRAGRRGVDVMGRKICKEVRAIMDRLIEGPATFRQLGTILARVSPVPDEKYQKMIISNAFRQLRRSGHKAYFDTINRVYTVEVNDGLSKV
jgi:hypothetical protein